MDERIQRALENDRTIDITTTGRNSGQPRRIEIWQYRYDGRTFLSGSPGTRDWYANLLADPQLTFHLKGSAQADLPAVARPITEEAERREVIHGILEDLGRGYGSEDEWVGGSPLVEVEFPLNEPPPLPSRAVSSDASAGWRRLRPLVLGTAAIAAVAATGCGEKPEPSVHPPTTAAITTTTPAPPQPGATTTAPAQTPTAPVPKTTP